MTKYFRGELDAGNGEIEATLSRVLMRNASQQASIQGSNQAAKLIFDYTLGMSPEQKHRLVHQNGGTAMDDDDKQHAVSILDAKIAPYLKDFEEGQEILARMEKYGVVGDDIEDAEVYDDEPIDGEPLRIEAQPEPKKKKKKKRKAKKKPKAEPSIELAPTPEPEPEPEPEKSKLPRRSGRRPPIWKP
ncbi:hypothetical protein [Shimia thalassica]|uniref:hypothetical protein n=1 Tax=Shimia thalassica TaxID=1715693 RepID=UPI0011A54321|nr:hypothetical protein [Shimia thalassica]